MNFSFRFVPEKVSFCLVCGRPVTHRSPNVDPTRPATAGRPDQFLVIFHSISAVFPHYILSESVRQRGSFSQF